jgi:hypothetical protein
MRTCEQLDTFDLDDALDMYQVEENESEDFPKGWWLVTSSSGHVIGSFPTEKGACSYRLYMVNRLLNG